MEKNKPPLPEGYYRYFMNWYVRNAHGKIVTYSSSYYKSYYDRRSIVGNLFFHHSNLVSWSLKKIAFVALSTLEAECATLSIGGRQAIWLCLLDGALKDLAPKEYYQLHSPKQSQTLA
jgi:hypothetical protein